MPLKVPCLCLWLLFVGSIGFAQDSPRWNFTIGGGVGFPQHTSATFANNGANFVIGGGPNIRRFLGLDAEFMWHDLPVKRNVIDALQVPNAKARVYAVSVNAIVPIPTHGKLGFYVIGGGGWYHRSGELTEPVLVPGEICAPFYLWWGGCVDGLVPASKTLASSHSDAFGGNIGGGVTYSLRGGPLKFFGEVRYHHALNHQVSTDLLPLTFGLRW